MQLREYLTLIQKWWWLLVACVLVSTLSSYIGVLQMPRIYQATATVMVGQSLQKVNPSSNDLYISQQLAQTYAEMVKRRPILEGAARALALEFVPAPANVSARLVPGTQLLETSVRDTDPERARALADEIARQLILQSPTDSPEQQERSVFVQEQLADLQAKIDEAREEIDAEQAKLDAANSARAIQQYQSNIGALQQKLSSYQSTYASMLLTVQGGVNYITIVEPASTPEKPLSPNVAETVLLAAAIGLALAVGGVFLIEFMDDTIKSPDEAARLAGQPLLAAIARIEGDEYPDKLIAAKHPLSPISEAFRVLRTNIQFSSIDKPLRTLAIVSPGPGDGKSITVANLGVVLAQSGLKVVIVDTDLRRPVQHKIFNLPNDDGVCDALLQQGGPDLLKHLQATEVDNLSVLTSGKQPPNPAELLASERMGELIAALQEYADIVLFDSPPALIVADAVILGSRVDGVLIVNDLNKTRRRMARQAAVELNRARANLLGLVLNHVGSGIGSYYYHYYYYYYSGNGNGNGNGDGRGERRRHRSRKGLQGWLARVTGNKERTPEQPHS